MKTAVLFVPGFVVDVYSEIEKSFVDLCTTPDDNLEFLWLVPHISNRHNAYSSDANRGKLIEPVYVTHLRRAHVRYIQADISKWNAIANYRVFRDIFREYRIDVVYTHFGYERFWATLFGALWRKRTVWNEHWHSLGRRFGWAKRLFYRLFVDEFIAVSRFIGETLRGYSTVHTIPNAVEPAKGPVLSDAERRQLCSAIGLKAHAPVVLMVAAFRAEKRHDLALAVVERVLRHRSEAQFVFLGSGPLRRDFLGQIQKRTWSGVRAPGHVDNVEDFYRVADVCMLTSENEPFGYCVLEGMKHGVPVVCFDTGGPAEILVNNATGMLLPPADVEKFAAAIVRLLEHAHLRRTMGERARNAVAMNFNRLEWRARIKRVLVAGPEQGASGTRGSAWRRKAADA